MRCSTCRWWEEAGIEWTGGRVPPRYNPTDIDPALEGWGVCQMVNESTDLFGALLLSLGYCEEDIGLLTAPDFGCVRWKPKEGFPG